MFAELRSLYYSSTFFTECPKRVCLMMFSIIWLFIFKEIFNGAVVKVTDKLPKSALHIPGTASVHACAGLLSCWQTNDLPRIFWPEGMECRAARWLSGKRCCFTPSKSSVWIQQAVVWSWNFLQVPALGPPTPSPQSKNMQVRWTGNSIACRWTCLSPCVSPMVYWRCVQGVPFPSANVSWDSLQPRASLHRTSRYI